MNLLINLFNLFPVLCPTHEAVWPLTKHDRNTETSPLITLYSASTIRPLSPAHLSHISHHYFHYRTKHYTSPTALHYYLHSLHRSYNCPITPPITQAASSPSLTLPRLASLHPITTIVMPRLPPPSASPLPPPLTYSPSPLYTTTITPSLSPPSSR